MIHPFPGLSLLVVLCTAALSGCGWEEAPAAPAHDVASEPTGEGPDAHGQPGSHDGHGPGGDEGEPEVSDLDRPVEELFAATCEHAVPTHRCDECRYEVGVVKVAPDLLSEGLIQVGRAEPRAATSPLALTGEVAFDERRVAEVSTQADGIIREVPVTLGDRVRKGQVILRIESIEVGEAQAAYLEALGLLALAERNQERVSTLYGQGVSAEKDLLVVRQERDAAAIHLEAAQGRLSRLGVDAGSIANLSPRAVDGRFALRAPQAGTILRIHAVPGETARAEEPLVTIGDGAAVWVWADVYERDVPAIQSALSRGPVSATVTVKSRPAEDFAGRVDFVSPAMDRDTRTARLRISLDNPDGCLMDGMFARIVVHLPGSEQALAVPRQAVLEDEGRSFVFIRQVGDYFVRRPVRVARAAGDWTELAGGLVEGAEVVTKGAFLLKSDVLRSKMGAGCAD